MSAAPASSMAEHRSAQPRPVDDQHPSLDPRTGLATRRHFERSLAQCVGDRATLVVLDIDDFDQITDEFGSEIADRVVMITAERIVNGCSSTDRIARIGTDAFAVLFDDSDRATGLRVAKHLLATIALPLSPQSGPDSITATAAPSHQVGLIDADELFESAQSSLESGKRTGRARLFVCD